ncbi:YbaK/EbsC family protein [Fusibacter bizertensis]|uniref:YbaK/EbsC family protein n=1 Tax=Fusibacter bizertensis TaxID=1488331 RepID=A0ABT6NAS6_9FIRM|nr:YbaK/EbsC family protein [Fusibacter bizertensis]MDH8677518.1 YbaK/EbsC family protein [Fusibacter bizertensis]
MSIEVVRKHLSKWDKDKDILEFETSSATVELAAKAVGVEPAKIAKSLSFRDGDKGMLVVVAGDAKIDNAKFKATFGFKARMLAPDEVLAYTGHAIGGVCPFGITTGIRVFLDESMKRFEHVYPACGSSNSAIKVGLDELEIYAETDKWVDVCRWESC